jgi:hypothetical protein
MILPIICYSSSSYSGSAAAHDTFRFLALYHVLPITGLVMVLLMALLFSLLILMLLIMVWHPLSTTVISSLALLVAQSKIVEN